MRAVLIGKSLKGMQNSRPGGLHAVPDHSFNITDWKCLEPQVSGHWVKLLSWERSNQTSHSLLFPRRSSGAQVKSAFQCWLRATVLMTYALFYLCIRHQLKSFLSLKPNGNHARAFHAGSVASWLFQVNTQGTCLPSFSLPSHEVVTASTSGGCAED